jgi:hypothetical protein
MIQVRNRATLNTILRAFDRCKIQELMMDNMAKVLNKVSMDLDKMLKKLNDM